MGAGPVSGDGKTYLVDPRRIGHQLTENLIDLYAILSRLERPTLRQVEARKRIYHELGTVRAFFGGDIVACLWVANIDGPFMEETERDGWRCV